MQLVLESLNFISLAADVDHFLLIRLEDTMALNDFPNTLLILGESSVLCIDLGFVLDLNLLVLNSKHFDTAEINLFTVNLNYWPNRVSEQLKTNWYRYSFKFNIEWNTDYTKNFCLKTDIDHLFLVRFDNSTPDVRLEETDAASWLLLGCNLELASQVILIDDLDRHSLLVTQETC